ncbi:MAG: reverse transcriptase domain-containing protein [Rhizobiaceae bacterium]
MKVFSLKLQQLKAAENVTDLAKILGVQPKTISFVVYKLPIADKYRAFTIPKRGGGTRDILAPDPRLKLVQSRLSMLLLEIEEILERDRTRHHCILAHGFKRNLSIITNAENHRNQRYVFNADLKDFFPSINFGRVRGFFLKNDDFALKPAVATLIAQIACHNNQLPQGSPCSPPISNFIAHIMDIHLNKLARKNRCTYTRYADDLTFSTNEKEFPSKIASLVNGTTDRWAAGDGLVSRVHRAGFQLNVAKTRMQYKDSVRIRPGSSLTARLTCRWNTPSWPEPGVIICSGTAYRSMW